MLVWHCKQTVLLRYNLIIEIHETLNIWIPFVTKLQLSFN